MPAPASAYHLRPFTPADYEALLFLGRLAFGEDGPMDLETLRRRDAAGDLSRPRGRIFAMHENGEALGMANWVQQRGTGGISFWIVVRPEERRRGIGGALYDAVLAEIAPLAPPVLQTTAREDRPDTCSFLERRGFTEAMRSWSSRLPLADFRPEPFAGVEEAVVAQGIILRTLAEIAADREAFPQVYETEQTLWRDVPSPDPYVPIPFDRWERQALQDPHSLPEAYFIAVDIASGAFVGVSTLTRLPDSKDLQTGLTGVRPEYRRRGIALALKLRAALYAREAGAPTIRTGNSNDNIAMLAINERLGFQRQSARIRYARRLTAIPLAG